MGKKVITIHGFAGGVFQFGVLDLMLRRHGDAEVLHFFYKERFGGRSLIEIAEDFSDYFHKNTSPDDDVVIVGFSQGGVIANYFVHNLLKRKVKMMITIASPHHGTFWPKMYNRVGTRCLAHGSDFLKSLNERPLLVEKIYTFYTPFDLMILPGRSGKLKYANQNYRVWCPAHDRMTTWGFVVREICSLVYDKIVI